MTGTDQIRGQTLKPFRSQNSPGSSRCAVVGFAGTSMSGPRAGAPVLRSAEAERVSAMRVVQAWPDRNPIAALTDASRGSPRSEEHTSELQSLMRISYAVFCLKKKKQTKIVNNSCITHHKTAHDNEI